MIHLVTGVLRKLDVEEIFRQAKDLDAMRAKSLRDRHPEFG